MVKGLDGVMGGSKFESQCGKKINRKKHLLTKEKKSYNLWKPHLQNILQVSMKNPHFLSLSVSLPTPAQETVLSGGLPFGAIEAIKASYGVLVQILDPPKDGFNLTLRLNLSKLPPDEGSPSFFSKVIMSLTLPCRNI